MTARTRSVLQFQFFQADQTVFSSLGHEEVHVWQVALDARSPQVSQLEQMLSSEELKRARGFRSQTRCNEFILTRGRLRILLGTYLGIQPGDVEFSLSPKGKPYLADSMRSEGLTFSISHAE